MKKYFFSIILSLFILSIATAKENKILFDNVIVQNTEVLVVFNNSSSLSEILKFYMENSLNTSSIINSFLKSIKENYKIDDFNSKELELIGIESNSPIYYTISKNDEKRSSKSYAIYIPTQNPDKYILGFISFIKKNKNLKDAKLNAYLLNYDNNVVWRVLDDLYLFKAEKYVVITSDSNIVKSVIDLVNNKSESNLKIDNNLLHKKNNDSKIQIYRILGHENSADIENYGNYGVADAKMMENVDYLSSSVRFISNGVVINSKMILNKNANFDASILNNMDFPVIFKEWSFFKKLVGYKKEVKCNKKTIKGNSIIIEIVIPLGEKNEI